ncbi:hypothetical protein PENTCL1PPCAC_3566 [Pristionchus entomophagus]|uniref:C6 domain-containing protein n=1 Tax=Pristionchus entomophagus TaxID=358040 RepID=A0AAV5SDH4_9BILA|nr:hypothetical protein PENTCL1PPCAC_3566 [Pristionchus entomophagus]
MMIILLILLAYTIQSVIACFPTATPGPPSIDPCKQCAKSLITKGGGTAFDPDMDSLDPTTGCAIWTLKCTSAVGSATITINGGAIPPETGAPTATIMVACDATGTAWTYLSYPVSTLDCS